MSHKVTEGGEKIENLMRNPLRKDVSFVSQEKAEPGGQYINVDKYFRKPSIIHKRQ